ncbi:MAG: hypothetical protein KGN77_05130 [Xanthomonadaceae bacterium]|nr:hypothetical protein [Xanthomonadaceae bacterium]
MTEPRTQAEWDSYWRSEDARLEAAAYDRAAAAVPPLAELVEADLARTDWRDDPNHRSLCPAGTPYDGRP